MLLITAANGKVGSRVVPYLVKQGFDIRVIDLNPTVERYKDIGVKEVHVGDASEAKIMRKAMQGCDQVLYIPPQFSYQETKMANLATDEAVNAGVRKFVQMSVIHPHMSTLLQHTMKLHAEEYLIYKGLSDGLNYTILQPVHYHHNIFVNELLDKGEFYNYNGLDIPLAFVDAEDVAEVAAKVLREDGHQNATYQLCGPSYLNPVECADLFNKVAGAKVVAKYIEADQLSKFWPGYIQQDSYAKETFIHLQYTYTKYGFSGNKNVLEWLLGRKGTDLGQFFRKELERLGHPVKG